jgi:hypothetical protein
VANWEVLCPVAKIVFDISAPNFHVFRVELARIAGVKEVKGIWHVPYNALAVAEALAGNYDVGVAAASWLTPPSGSAPTWEEVETTLREAGEVQPFLFEGFLMPYQKEAIRFGWNNAGVHYWHPTGSGKSCTGIICSLSQPGSLIIVTRAASRIQYGREVERFTNLKAHVVRPESQMRKKDQPLQAYLRECMEEGRRAVVILGWESVKNNMEMLKTLRAGTVIYDESHRGKNAKRWDTVPLPDLPSDQAEALAQMKKDKAEADKAKGFIKDTEEGRRLFLPHVSTASAAAELARLVRKRICTTATPIKDRVRDLYAQLDLAEPNGWGNTTAWMARYADAKPGIYGGVDTTGSSNVDELNLRLTTVAHILDYRETHRELPAKRRQSVYIPPEEQVKPDASFNKAMKEAQARGPGALLEVKLQRSACMKRRGVLDLIEDHVGSNQKVCVFTGRKADCEDLGEAVKKLAIVKKKNAKVWAAHGEQTTAVRQRIVDDYMQSEGPCVLIATGQSFGESLNLHDTDAALFVMLPYDPGQLRQWEGRFTRLGQKRPVVIYYVIAEGTVDEHVAQLLIEKLPAVERIARDSELAEAGSVLAGYDGMNPDEFAESVLSQLDFD